MPTKPLETQWKPFVFLPSHPILGDLEGRQDGSTRLPRQSHRCAWCVVNHLRRAGLTGCGTAVFACIAVLGTAPAAILVARYLRNDA